jgi:UDP-GlcNAc:undecaprenyl-phosphate/decaprenyl-phosphate GlcNAc-1-phosphate transferase
VLLALVAFVVAAGVTMAGTPALRQVALVTGFIDRPGKHKSHAVPVAYLGGVAIIIGSVSGSIVGSSTPKLGLYGLVGVVLGVVGLLDDDRLLHPGLRLVVQVGCAALAVAAGIRVDITGVGLFDGLLTIVWIVAITNAVNFLDNMDGLAAGVMVVAASATGVIAALGDQLAVGAMAAAVAGACVGFLAFNIRPASIYMGDSGSLFLGFVVAVLVLEVKPGVTPPSSFAVPTLLLMLPVIDIITVVLGRLRRGIPVTVGGRNHLSHRLVARGLGRGAAVAVLVAVEIVTASLAVAIARDGLSVLPALVIAGVLLTALTLFTVNAPVWETEVIGFPRTLTRVALGGGLLLVVLATPAVLALWSARGEVSRGSAATERAILALRQGNYALASQEFERATEEFEEASRRLDSRVVSLGLAVPVLNSNLAATRRLADTTSGFASVGADLAQTVSDNEAALAASSTLPDEFAQKATGYARISEHLRSALGRLSIGDRGFLVPSLRDKVRDLQQHTLEALIQTEQSEAFSRTFPSIMGATGPRRYLLVVQDVAVAPPHGSAFTASSVLTLEGGQPRLTDVTSSDFAPATWADLRVVAANLLSESDGRGAAYDGVVVVDADGLASLVSLSNQRSATGSPPPRPSADAAVPSTAFDYAFGTQHVQLYLARASEQVVMETLGAGSIGPPKVSLDKAKGG